MAADYRDADLDVLQKLAREGDVDAKHHLGMFYYQGYRVAQDLKLAMVLLNEAAASGHALAMRDYLCIHIDHLIKYTNHFDDAELAVLFGTIHAPLMQLQAVHDHREIKSLTLPKSLV